jgi:hypothetical protein
MTPFEEIRASYRPRRITTLFVGESAPHGGTFFYNQDSGLFREMRKAFRGEHRFLDVFRQNGFYLDDLVLEPVNHLAPRDRRIACKQSIASFANRLKDYKPAAVVILLRSIETIITEAMQRAGLCYQPFCTPYPGFGNQPRFHKAMAEIIPQLPVAGNDGRSLRRAEGPTYRVIMQPQLATRKSTTMKSQITLIALVVLLISSISLHAQAPVAIAVPSQFATARTAFLGSGPTPAAGLRQTAVAQVVYSTFYRSLSAVGQYRLVSAPADAELSMVLSTDSFMPNSVSGGFTSEPYLRLETYDTKTHSLLWTLDEPLNGYLAAKTLQQNVDQTVAALINDLKTLASGSVPGDPAAAPTPQPTKKRLSEEGKK